MRNFGGIPSHQYVGTPAAFPVQLSIGLTNQVVPLTLPWLIYGAATAAPNQSVLVDLTGNNVSARTGTLQSVFIDNLGSNISVYVRCLDTNYTVTAQPNSCGWYPIYTNLMTFQIIGMGFVDAIIPTTLVMFSNLRIIPSVDIELATSVALWLASNTITRGTGIQNTNYGAPALGDQTINFADALGAGITGILHNGIWNTPQVSGFVYLTHANIWIHTPNAGGGVLVWDIESAGAAGVLWTFQCSAGFQGFANILSFSSMNIKLDAAQTWRINVTTNTFGASAVVLNHTFNWTQNPN